MPALTMFEVTPDHPVPISPQGGTATVTVLSGDTLYYADTPQVSAAHNQGSVTAGNVQSFTNPAWVRSASLSTVLAQITAALPVGVTDTSIDPTSPIVPAALPRNRALRDFVSVLDYGTYTSGDMTSTWASCLADASAKGAARGAKFKVLAPPNTYQVTSITANCSYVDLHAHGAVFTRPASYASNQAFFWGGGIAGAPLTQFALRGLVVPGTGAELPFQGVLFSGQASHVTVEDCELTNSAAFLTGFEDGQYLWVDRNKVSGFVSTSQNAINFINKANGATSPLKHLWARGNIVEGTAIGIAIVSGDGATRTDPDVDGHIEGNTCVSTGTGWPIAVEQGGATTGGAPNVKNIDISGNTCRQQTAGANAYGLVLTNDSTPLSNDPLCISGVTVRGNRIFATGAGSSGLRCQASHAAITGNYIEAAVDDIWLSGHGTATILDHVISGNVGHMGTGKHVNVFSQVDTTKLSSSNTQ